MEAEQENLQKEKTRSRRFCNNTKMATSYDSDHLHSVDDVYFLALHGEEGMEEEGGPYPDDAKYAEELRFQEALMGSVLISQMNKVENPVPDQDGATSGMKVKAIVAAADDTTPILGESSLSFCGICTEGKEKEQMFEGSSCVHSYCFGCIGNHVVATVHNDAAVVTCPGFGCEVVLELEACRPSLSKSVIEAWSDLLCREMVETSERCYCPYKDCSAMIITDEQENIAEAECPVCHRLFCPRCSVPWHAGVECEAYQKLNPVPDQDGAKSQIKEKAVVVANDTSPIVGQSSLSFCGICMERKEKEQMFEGSSCVHSYCLDCIGKHVLAKVNDNVAVVTCPGFGCKVVLELEACSPTLSKSVIEAWSDLLCHEMIQASESCYCPYKDCSAVMITDEQGNIAEAECPVCHRLFCARCSVPWHAGVECEAYQRLNEDEKGRDDVTVIRLAEENKWSRCPNCRFYVERTEGCSHMVCRCRFEFCYGCGSQWAGDHGGCSRN